jgi:hypothetical protein
MASRHVNESLRTISHNFWSIGDKLILSRDQNSKERLWCDSDEWCYSISPNTDAPSPSANLSPTHSPVPVSLVHEAACGIRLNPGHAVWSIGNAYLKVMAIEPSGVTATREHVTLQALHQRSVTFAIPEVLYHGEWEGRYYIITTEVPGQSLQQAW